MNTNNRAAADELAAARRQLTRARSGLRARQALAHTEGHRRGRLARWKAAFDSIKDAPETACQRSFMLDAVEHARNNLARRGIDICVADLQAVLWKYEKRLYGELGAKQTANVSHEKAAKVVASGDDRADGRPVQGVRADAGRDADKQGQSPGEEDFQTFFQSSVTDRASSPTQRIWYRGQIGPKSAEDPFAATAGGRAPSLSDDPEVASTYALDPRAAGLYSPFPAA